jgi:hypothetical protein
MLKSLVWWCTPVIPALKKLSQEDGELEVSLGYMVRYYLKNRQTYMFGESLKTINTVEWMTLIQGYVSR